ncbi:ion transporter [Streptomyces sp. ST2-7A]|nr:ion transporter [Streptomyces sp. ST2-7A]
MVCALILLNAVLLGAETYISPGAVTGPFPRVEAFLLTAFTTEITLRAVACVDRPREFFRDPWNVFDLTVVVLTHLPLTQGNATILRVLRLLRVARVARMMPQIRVIVTAVGKSLPGMLGFLALGVLILYVYGMVGWQIFAVHDPERFGTLDRAVITLFLLATFDGIGAAVRDGLEVSPWTLLYYGSYVLFAGLMLINLLIGVVVGSMDEAREAERRRLREGDGPDRERDAGTEPPGGGDPDRFLRERVEVLRRVLEEMESRLAERSDGPGEEVDRPGAGGMGPPGAAGTFGTPATEALPPPAGVGSPTVGVERRVLAPGVSARR